MSVKRPPVRRPKVAGYHRIGKRRTEESPAGDVPVVDIEPPVAEVEDDETEPAPRSHLPLVLVLAAALLVGLGAFFMVRANSVDQGVDTRAMTEVNGQVRSALEKVLSYSYDKVDESAAAVREVLASSALAEYEKLIGQVRALAPEQKLVLATRVTNIGVRSIEGDRAELLVFLDQVSTRVDTGKTSGGAAALSVTAERWDNGAWKIVELVPR